MTTGSMPALCRRAIRLAAECRSRALRLKILRGVAFASHPRGVLSYFWATQTATALVGHGAPPFCVRTEGTASPPTYGTQRLVRIRPFLQSPTPARKRRNRG